MYDSIRSWEIDDSSKAAARVDSKAWEMYEEALIAPANDVHAAWREVRRSGTAA